MGVDTWIIIAYGTHIYREHYNRLVDALEKENIHISIGGNDDDAPYTLIFPEKGSCFFYYSENDDSIYDMNFSGTCGTGTEFDIEKKYHINPESKEKMKNLVKVLYDKYDIGFYDNLDWMIYMHQA
jgi:hypothetical protein